MTPREAKKLRLIIPQIKQRRSALKSQFKVLMEKYSTTGPFTYMLKEMHDNILSSKIQYYGLRVGASDDITSGNAKLQPLYTGLTNNNRDIIRANTIPILRFSAYKRKSSKESSGAPSVPVTVEEMNRFLSDAGIDVSEFNTIFDDIIAADYLHYYIDVSNEITFYDSLRYYLSMSASALNKNRSDVKHIKIDEREVLSVKYDLPPDSFATYSHEDQDKYVNEYVPLGVRKHVWGIVAKTIGGNPVIKTKGKVTKSYVPHALITRLTNTGHGVTTKRIPGNSQARKSEKYLVSHYTILGVERVMREGSEAQKLRPNELLRIVALYVAIIRSSGDSAYILFSETLNTDLNQQIGGNSSFDAISSIGKIGMTSTAL